ncbi:hypothetical protein [Sorangium sp. So ce1097]|uniref:hypothetical protein n=1 Tax=Sorangium sp. So ce1097 TaxID=3133330 RepID=UPI003F6091B8
MSALPEVLVGNIGIDTNIYLHGDSHSKLPSWARRPQPITRALGGTIACDLQDVIDPLDPCRRDFIAAAELLFFSAANHASPEPVCAALLRERPDLIVVGAAGQGTSGRSPRGGLQEGAVDRPAARRARRARQGLSVALAAALAAAATEARAEEGAWGVDLDWAAPDACADGGRVLAEIEQRLGRPAAAQGGPRLGARAEVSQNARGSWDLRLTTTLGEATSSRDLHGETCAELASAAALIIALALDPEAAARAPMGAAPGAGPGADAGAGALPDAGPGAPDGAAAPDARAAGAPPAASSPPPPDAGRPAAPAGVGAPREARLALRGALRAFGVLDASALPAVAPGAGLAAGALLGAVRAEVSGAYFGAQKALVPATPMGGDVWLASGALRLCYASRHKDLEIGPCAGLEAGVMSATGFGVTSPGSNRALWLAPQLGALATYALSDKLRVPLAVEVLFPVVRDEFVLVGIGSVHRIPAVTVRAALGVELRLP